MKLNLVSKITAPVVRGASKLKFKAVKYSPEICLVGGIVVGVATVVSACKATLKADDILDQLEADKAKIAEAEVAAVELKKEYNKDRDMAIAYRDCAFRFVKLYGPTIALGAISGALILCSYGTLKKRNMGLIAAYTALDGHFRKYRERAVEKYGEDVDRELATGIKTKEVMVKGTNPETGEVVASKEEVPTMDEVMLADPTNYDRIFARGLAAACQTYDDNVNEAFLTGMQAHFTRLLQTRGYVFLSEIYEKLGFPVTAGSRLVGWILDYADPDYRSKKVSFGFMPKVYDNGGDYVHPTGRIEPSYIDSGYYLTFNIDGLIWDLI